MKPAKHPKKPTSAIKTAVIPPLRVEPELRDAAIGVLHPGETLSAFAEESLRSSIARRQWQLEFIARGLASRDEARRTGDYVDARELHTKLRAKLAAAKPGEADR